MDVPNSVYGKVIVVSPSNKTKELTAFTLTHVRDEYKCDYQILRIDNPGHCNTLEWKTLQSGGCKWHGNSQVDGKIDATLTVYAQRKEKYKKEINDLETNISTLRKQVKDMENDAIY